MQAYILHKFCNLSMKNLRESVNFHLQLSHTELKSSERTSIIYFIQTSDYDQLAYRLSADSKMCVSRLFTL